MNGIIQLQIGQFLLIYLLLLVVLVVMRVCHIDQTRLLVVSSMKMTVQLILAGLILTYIFEHPHPLFVVAYLGAMTGFSIHRVLSKNRDLNPRFRLVTGLSIAGAGLCVLAYFVALVVGEGLFNPQYVIPIGGMVMGNTMTGVSLGVKTFRESIHDQRSKIEALVCVGASAEDILLPFVRQALETAMLPTLNSMVGMGIVSLPGMMTGQILAGTLPMTSILYQIAIMIAICTAVTCACFGTLYFGSKTLYDKKRQIIQIKSE